MSEHYEKHAEQVSQAFFELLPTEVQAMISEEHRNELAMLVEAAISTAVFQELEQAADQVAALSKRIRSDAEHYDKT
jgi:hypothetical protein